VCNAQPDGAGFQDEQEEQMSENSSKKTVEARDLWAVYLLLEEMNRFLHQPMNYESPDEIRKWLRSGVYKRLKHAYYDIGGKWFPVDEETGEVIAPPGDDT
jgi:hypothetical protein